MFIMTDNGYRPLVSFDAHWAAKHLAIDTAKAAVDAASALPLGASVNDETRKENHHIRMAASARFQAACDAFHD